MKIKREWLIDRAVNMLQLLDEDIDRRQQHIDKLKAAAEREEEESESRAKELEEDFTEQGYTDDDIKRSIQEYYDAVSDRLDKDYYSVIENEDLQLIALKQGREIYTYYLNHHPTGKPIVKKEG